MARVHKLWSDKDVTTLKRYIKFKGWTKVDQILKEDQEFPSLDAQLEDERTGRAIQDKLIKVLLELNPEARPPIFSKDKELEQRSIDHVWKLFIEDGLEEDKILRKVNNRFPDIELETIQKLIKERRKPLTLEFQENSTKKPTIKLLREFYKLKDRQDSLSKSALRKILNG